MSENSTPTPQEPAGTKKKSLIPTALILTLASVGAYGIYTGSVTDWVNQGIDKVSNPTELFAYGSNGQEAAGQSGGRTPNLFPDNSALTYPDSEGAIASPQAPALTQSSTDLVTSQEVESQSTSDSATTIDDDTSRTHSLGDSNSRSSTTTNKGGEDEASAGTIDANGNYHLDIGGGRSTSSSDTTKGLPSHEAPSSKSQEQPPAPEDQGAYKSSPTPIPEPEEMEAELALIHTDNESASAPETDDENEASPSPSSENDTLSEEEQQQIIESPEFTGTIAAIGRRVGQSWQYAGEDYDEHGAILKVHLDDTGDATDFAIIRSSGNDAYDASVLSAAKDAAPFHEVLELDDTAQALLTDFALTFGSREAIDAWEAQWTVHEPIDVAEESAGQAQGYAAQVRRMIEAQWVRPDTFTAESEVSVQVRLAVPLGNVLAINFLRPSDDEVVNESISEAILSASPFDGIRQLTLEKQKELQQFNIHFSAEGIR